MFTTVTGIGLILVLNTTMILSNLTVLLLSGNSIMKEVKKVK